MFPRLLILKNDLRFVVKRTQSSSSPSSLTLCVYGKSSGRLSHATQHKFTNITLYYSPVLIMKLTLTKNFKSHMKISLINFQFNTDHIIKIHRVYFPLKQRHTKTETKSHQRQDLFRLHLYF